MYRLLRNLLFCLPPERSHQLALSMLDLGRYLPVVALLRQREAFSRARPVRLMGLELPNPVGLAAGLDKNGEHIEALAALGFGFIEIGTVTPRPQPGNPKPRLFRLRQDEAIINRMGFNNKGIDHALACVQRSRYRGVLGINIGKNRDTPVDRAVDDYLTGMRKAYGAASYLVVNLSSPNTPGLRSLQFGDELDRLLDALKEEQQRLVSVHDKKVPLVIKIAPDLEEREIERIAASLLAHDVEGVIATNTTLDRQGLGSRAWDSEAGGLSGAPLKPVSERVVRQLHGLLEGRIPIIGAGGINSGQDASDRVRAGASAIQLYTGFIYHGPALIAESVAALAELDRETGSGE